MSEVVFEEPTIEVTAKSKKSSRSTLENKLVQWGVVKTVGAARVILIIFLIIACVGIILIQYAQSSPGNSYGNYDTFIKNNPDLFY